MSHPRAATVEEKAGGLLRWCAPCQLLWNSKGTRARRDGPGIEVYRLYDEQRLVAIHNQHHRRRA